jgi:hypothetical protein
VAGEKGAGGHPDPRPNPGSPSSRDHAGPTPRREASAAFTATLAATMPSKTVRLVEIADILGVTHQRPSMVARGADFPRPVGRQGRSRVWDRREVAAWAKVWRREKPWR